MCKFYFNTIRLAILYLILTASVSAQQNAQPFKSGEKLVITTSSGDQHVGRTLFVTDSLLVLWKSPEIYDEHKLHALAKPLHFSEINKFAVEKTGHTGKGAGRGFLIGGSAGAIGGAIIGVFVGVVMSSAGANANEVASFIAASTLGGMAAFGAAAALVGGTVGATKDIDDHFPVNGNIEIYKRIAPTLRKNAIFVYGPPPELQALVMQAVKPFSLPSSGRQTLAEQKDGNLQPPSMASVTHISKPPAALSAPKFHLSIDNGMYGSRASHDIVDAFHSSGFGAEYPEDSNASDSWGIDAEYSLTDRLRLGLARSNIKPLEIVWEENAVESFEITSTSLLLGYVFVPVDPLLISRWEFAVGAGLSYSSLSVAGTLGRFSPSASHFAVKENAVGGHLRARLDYYISRKLSMQLKLEGLIMPAINVPETRYKTLTLESHSVNFSGSSLSVGARLHF